MFGDPYIELLHGDGWSFRSAILVGKTTSRLFRDGFFKRSEYVLQLSEQSRQRYEENLNKVGLTSDPY